MKLEFICLIIVITIVIVASYFIAQTKTYNNLIEWEKTIPNSPTVLYNCEVYDTGMALEGEKIEY